MADESQRTDETKGSDESEETEKMKIADSSIILAYLCHFSGNEDLLLFFFRLLL
jgi:hypothetical protein